MYVAYEPTWEWRFIKEVFHRDKLVGMQGFRTFLGSSDPQVRESNVLFLPTLTPKRSEFFANDVIFLDDMPRAALSDRFCEMVKEFVGKFGGGLVVIAGPRFGPRELQRHAAGRHAARHGRSATPTCGPHRAPSSACGSRRMPRAIRFMQLGAERRGEPQGLGQSRPAAVVSAGRRACTAGRRAGRASDRQVRATARRRSR